MPTDKLAIHRAQRQLEGAGQSHELSSLEASNGRLSDMPAFLSEVTSIQNSIGTYNANVTRISSLHSRLFNSLSEEAASLTVQRDTLTAETMALSSDLKERIKLLQVAVTSGRRQEKDMRQNSVTLVRSKFMEALQTYQLVEQEQREKSRQRIERQYRIVKPDATQEELAKVVSEGGDQIFMQTFANSGHLRSSESRSAYNEVQTRAQDLRKLENTLAELAQLFSDMATLVELQNETIEQIETTAVDVEANTAKGLEHTEEAVTIAARLRRKRWIFFFIVLIVVIILAVVLAIEFTKK
ncbi:syntaxin [Mycena rebaudengoi]|nr:syntaxin [Mycena rebaudengoi]